MKTETDDAGILIRPSIKIEGLSLPETKQSFLAKVLEKNRALVSENEMLKRRIGELVEQIK